MPSNQELEAMCEQAFPVENDSCPACGPYDKNETARPKALALAMEARDKTLQTAIELIDESWVEPDEWADRALEVVDKLRSLLSESGKPEVKK